MKEAILYDSIHVKHEWVSEVAQLCPTLCNLVDCSPPGSSIHGIFQARILEWVAISFSRGSSRPRDWTQVYCTGGRRFTVWATREVPTLNIQIGKSTETERRAVLGKGWGIKGSASGVQGFFRGWWKRSGIRHCACTKSYRIACFKMVNFLLCDFYHNDDDDDDN